jgi:hypothetical protein
MPRVDACLRDDADTVQVAAHHPCFAGDVVGDDEIGAFLLQFGGGVFQQVLGLGGKAHHQIRALRMMTDAGENVGVFDQAEGRRIFARSLLDLLIRLAVGPPVGDGSDEDSGGGRQQLLDGVAHLPGRLDMGGLDAGRVGDRHRPGHQTHVGAEPGECCGDRMTLLAGRAVGDVADRVDRLMGRA